MGTVAAAEDRGKVELTVSDLKECHFEYVVRGEIKNYGNYALDVDNA